MFILGQCSRAASLLVLLVALPELVRAGDWPQLLGPQRNGQAVGETLPARLPDNFTAKLSYPLGAGYAGPAVLGQQIVAFHRVGGYERVEAIDRSTGARQWHADFPAEYEGGYNPDSGPRCVPLLHEGRAYVFGASGRLHCVELNSGKKLWSRALAKEYGAPDGYFGAGSTPIVADDKLIVMLGGRDGSGIVAVATETGKTAWTATDEQVSYASPTMGMLHGKPHWLLLTRLNLLSIDPANGNILFSHPFGQRGLSVTGATPIAFEDSILLSASYNIGAQLVRVSPTNEVAPVWSGDEILSSQYTSGVYHDGFVYGTHGREDSPRLAELRCIEAATGKVRWQKPDVGVAHVILADDKLLVVQVQTGDVVLLQANSQKYTELDRRHVTDDTLRALPALSAGVLYLRTSSNQNEGQLLGLPVQ